MRNFIFCCLALLLLPAFANAQAIRGKVVDETGLPLPGVSIVDTASKASTVTDIDGNFAIQAKAGDALKFSFIGYSDKTAAAAEGMSVSMAVAATALNEVVVIGYGTQKRANVTGSIATVKAAEIAKQPAFNALQSIQGKAAGVNIIASDAPGSNPTVIIRGIGTASAGRGILYVVDGVMTSSIANLNPADIETFDVMKDASSTAIYGTSAANGVILITTKKGKTGKTIVHADSYYGAKSMLNPVKMANSSQYVQYVNENLAANGATYSLSPNQPYNTNWFKTITDVAYSQSNNVSFSGGSENANYFLSVNNMTEDGLLKDQKNWRNSIRANSSFKAFNNRLKITENFSLSTTKANPKPYSAFDQAYRQSPAMPVYYPSGQYGQAFVNTTTGLFTYQAAPGETTTEINSVGNPVASIAFAKDETRSTDLQGNVEAELKLAKGLAFTSRYGATKTFFRARNYDDIRGMYLVADPTRTNEGFQALQDANQTSITYANNSLAVTQGESYRFNWDNYFTYGGDFGKHNVNVVAGISQERRNDIFQNYTLGYNVPVKSQYWNLGLSSPGYGYSVGSSGDTYAGTPTKIFSFFARAQYNFDEKYFLTAAIRRDGNSDFKQNQNYWGTFPSFSAGWVLTKESFLSDVKGVDFLKLRVGYGKLGNANVPFNTRSVFTGSGSNSYNYVFGPNQDLITGAALGSPAKDVSWEVTEEYNAGLDFEFLNRRLTGSVDYYNRVNKNAILLVTPTLDSPNSTNFYDHGAEVSNKGFEAVLAWKDRIGGDFTYGFSINGARNVNQLESVKSAYDGATGGSLGNGQITKRLQAGQPIYAWWLYEADGVWQSQAEIDANPHIGSPQPGQLRYKDLNGDGQIDNRDKKFFGSYLPKYTYGLNITLGYKNFDFSVDGYGAGGNKVYNGLKNTRINGAENVAADTFNGRWTGPGTSNVNPGANFDNLASSYYLEDGDYFRINNITLGYTFKDITESVSRIRVYGTAQNAFLFTKYSGFTPELQGNGNPGDTAGIELSAYPNVKTFLFGVNLEF